MAKPLPAVVDPLEATTALFAAAPRSDLLRIAGRVLAIQS